MSGRLARLAAERAPALCLRWARPRGALLGCCGEALAARALARAGWRILGRRVRTRFGEIDLVARAGTTLVCVEVKTGRVRADLAAPRWTPADRLRPSAFLRQARAARVLARRFGLHAARVDLLEVLVDDAGRARLAHRTDVGGAEY